MKILPIIFYVGIFLFLASSASAETIIKQGESNVNISIKESDGNTSVTVNNNEFTVSGTVKSVSGNTVNISGQPVNFGSGVPTPSVGQKVTVKGTLSNNGTMTATSISTDSSPSSLSPTPTPTPTPTSTPTPTITSTPSASQNQPAQLGQISKLLDELEKIFDQLFSILR